MGDLGSLSRRLIFLLRWDSQARLHRGASKVGWGTWKLRKLLSEIFFITFFFERETGFHRMGRNWGVGKVFTWSP